MNKITFTRYTSPEPLSKRYWTDKGLIQKQAAAQMTKGTAERVTMPFADFPQALAKATDKQAFGYGQHSVDYPDKVSLVVSGKEQPDKNIIARTKEYYTYLNTTCLQMLDHDPNEYGPVMSSEQLIQALTEIHPAIGQAARIVRGSVSAGVHKVGEQPRTDKGFHIYFPVVNAADIPRYGKLLFDWLWLNGFGFIALSSNGSLLERTVIDGAVFSPERLDFVGRPIISGSDLEYTPPPTTYIDGCLLDTESLPDLTDEEQATVEQLKAKAKNAIKPVAADKQKQWAADKIETMQVAGVSVEKAREVVSRILKGGSQDLYDDFLLEFTTGPVSVSNVLKNPTAFDGKALADPIEGPEYGTTTAKFWFNGGKPVINSRAHGVDRVYFLHITPPVQPTDTQKKPNWQVELDTHVDQFNKTNSFNQTLDTEHNYCTVDMLRHVDDNHLLKRLSKQVAEETHLPVNTVFLMGMTVYSSMAARKYAVVYPNGMKLPIGLYTVVEQPSGTGKSWCLNTFQKPFYKIHKALLDALTTKIKQFEKKQEAGEKLTDAEMNEYQEMLNMQKRLNSGIFVSNATPEGLETTLTHTSGFFSAISSEQGLFNSLLGCSYKSENSSNNNDVVLNGFDGGHVNSVRVGRNGYLGHVIGGVACFAQQGSIETLLKASNGTGLSERFLMLAEPHMLGKRDHMKTAWHDHELISEYANVCQFIKGIMEKPREFEGLSNLTISENGYMKINQYRNLIELHLLDGGRFSHISLRGAASKINMHIMKIAANLHLMDGGEYVPEIGDRHIDAAIDIANELLEANLKLCQDKGIIGVKSEFTAILSLFEKDQRPRTERNIITTKNKSLPFRDFTGNKSELIRSTLGEMVKQRVLIRLCIDGKFMYQLSQ